MLSQTDFEASDVLQHLVAAGYTPSVLFSQKQTLIAEIDGVKVDFIRFKYPFAEQVVVSEGIRLANIRDIACLKIDAITGRGRKKDFCDLYYLLQFFSLAEMMEAYSRMYTHSTLFHVYKSLTWFEDADMDGDMVVLDKKFDWEKTKKAIIYAVGNTI